jgi:predicted Rossmann-fold nucleotide-binding protein
MQLAVSGPVSISPAQVAGVRSVLARQFDEDDRLVTGGAYGVDTVAAVWAKGEGLYVHLIVPKDLVWHRELRAIVDEVTEVDGSYMERNEAVAEACDALLAFPYTKREHLRSGTWATVRRVQGRAKPVKVVALSRFK